jgi:hypothetical protein
VHTADRKFVATANGRNDSNFPHTFSSNTKIGVPGGCGIPSTRAAAMNSPESQNVTLGASVAA